MYAACWFALDGQCTPNTTQRHLHSPTHTGLLDDVDSLTTKRSGLGTSTTAISDILEAHEF